MMYFISILRQDSLYPVLVDNNFQVRDRGPVSTDFQMYKLHRPPLFVAVADATGSRLLRTVLGSLYRLPKSSPWI